MSFEIGDRVKVIDASGDSFARSGDRGYVSVVDDSIMDDALLTVETDRGPTVLMFASRFERLPHPFTVGDRVRVIHAGHYHRSVGAVTSAIVGGACYVRLPGGENLVFEPKHLELLPQSPNMQTLEHIGRQVLQEEADSVARGRAILNAMSEDDRNEIELHLDEAMDDPVSHPHHYNWLPSGVEVIDITESLDFCLGNVVKYVLRADRKGEPIQDLEKAAWYLDREINRRKAEAA